MVAVSVTDVITKRDFQTHLHMAGEVYPDLSPWRNGPGQLNIILVVIQRPFIYVGMRPFQPFRKYSLRFSALLFDPATFFQPQLSDLIISPADNAVYLQALRQRDLIVIRLSEADPDAIALKHFVSVIGEAAAHDDKGTLFWDVKYDGSVDQTSGARSLTTSAFPLHTDASFEDPQPQYVAFYVIKEDSMGGGVSQIVDGQRVLPLLSPNTLHILQNTLFKFRVPAEFRKEKQNGTGSFIEKPIIDQNGHFRFRREIIVHEDLQPEQIQAIDELDLHLQDDDLQESCLLPTGTILIFNNGRFLHARSRVLDRSRHLIRMRFNGRANETTNSSGSQSICAKVR